MQVEKVYLDIKRSVLDELSVRSVVFTLKKCYNININTTMRLMLCLCEKRCALSVISVLLLLLLVVITVVELVCLIFLYNRVFFQKVREADNFFVGISFTGFVCALQFLSLLSLYI